MADQVNARGGPHCETALLCCASMGAPHALEVLLSDPRVSVGLVDSRGYSIVQVAERQRGTLPFGALIWQVRAPLQAHAPAAAMRLSRFACPVPLCPVSPW